MWRSQRARESIITYRYELTLDTTWYLSMRLHLLWCDASIPNDICYAISVRLIFPTLTYTSRSLYFHIGGREDFLFSQSGAWTLGLLHPGQACYPWATSLGLLEKSGCSPLVCAHYIPQVTAWPKPETEVIPVTCHKDTFLRLQSVDFSDT